MTAKGKVRDFFKENLDLENLEDNIVKTPFRIIEGTLVGVASILIDPYAVPRQLKKANKEGIKNYPEFMYNFTHLLSYMGGLAGMGYFLSENPEKPLAWVPVATNLISGVGQYAYKKGKERGLRQSTTFGE